MSQTIAGYTAAISIDAANDFLLIEPSGNTVYKKISRNVLLGLASAPLGTTDSQSPTNKTFDNTNAYTIKDGSLTLQNTSSLTKQATFSLSGITAGQTRVMTLPDANATLVGTATTQTLTNKTLTSPTITGGTIDNTTITVDSISGHSTSTIVTVANLQISNGVLNSANAVTATSIAASAVQPQALQSGTGSGWAWQSYTGTWTNLTPGNGTQVSRYIQTGKTVNSRTLFTLGSTSSVSGGITITLPVTANTSAYDLSNGATQIGTGTAIISGSVYAMVITLQTSTTALVRPINSASTYVTQADTSNLIPGTWTTGSIINFQYTFEAA